MEFIFRIKEMLRIPMTLSKLPYDINITTDDVDANGAGLFIHAENNVDVTLIGGLSIGMMDSNTIGSYDPYSLIDICE